MHGLVCSREKKVIQGLFGRLDHEQDDQGGDPDESDEEGQETRCSSVRMAHVNDRSLRLGIGHQRSDSFAGKPRTECRGKQENT